MTTTPLRALFEIIRDEQVDRIFGNPGTTELPLIDALVDEPDLRYVLGLQEGSVVAMADGYARASGRTSFVNLHVAAGVANGLIGLLNARRSRTPMVVTAGQQDRRHLLHEPMLSGDLVGLAQAATKSAFEVQHAADLPLVLRRAFAEAVRPPAGPVFVSIPMDLLAEEVEVAVPARTPPPAPATAGGLDAAVALLAGARDPVIIAGDGVGRERAVDQLVALAEAIGAAVYHQPMADGINFPGGHPLYHGMPLPTTAAIRTMLAPHDVALIVGTQAFMAHHYTPDEPIPAGTAVVQLDSDAAQLGRNFAVAVGLVGGLAPSLAELARRLDAPAADGNLTPGQTRAAARNVPARRRDTIPSGTTRGDATRSDATRRGDAVAARRKRHARTTAQARAGIDADALSRYGAAPMDPLAAAHAVTHALPADAIVVEEAITAGLLLRQVLRQDRPGSYVHTVGGGLGWGIGAAIGTRMGAPTRPVAAVLGDGCATFGLQGLWTAAHHRVPVAFVVFNNGEYRTLKDTLDRHKSRSTEHGRYVGLDLREPALDWAAAGRTFGVETVRAESCEHLAHLVAGLPDLTAPLLIEAPVRGHTPA